MSNSGETIRTLEVATVALFLCALDSCRASRVVRHNRPKAQPFSLLTSFDTGSTWRQLFQHHVTVHRGGDSNAPVVLPIGQQALGLAECQSPLALFFRVPSGAYSSSKATNSIATSAGGRRAAKALSRCSSVYQVGAYSSSRAHSSIKTSWGSTDGSCREALAVFDNVSKLPEVVRYGVE
jgi:hypothetical protein